MFVCLYAHTRTCIRHLFMHKYIRHIHAPSPYAQTPEGAMFENTCMYVVCRYSTGGRSYLEIKFKDIGKVN